MILKAIIKTEVKDDKGIIVHEDEHDANSFVIAFLDMLYGGMGQVVVGIPDTSNTSRAVSYGGSTGLSYQVPMKNFNVLGGVADNTYGIVVGTGSAAVTITDYKLGTIIVNGTGSGQLNYLTTSVTAPLTSGSSRSFKIVRSFTNQSGANITVNEVGLYGISYIASQVFLCYFCFDRTLNTFTINNGNTGTVTYTIQITA